MTPGAGLRILVSSKRITQSIKRSPPRDGCDPACRLGLTIFLVATAARIFSVGLSAFTCAASASDAHPHLVGGTDGLALCGAFFTQLPLPGRAVMATCAAAVLVRPSAAAQCAWRRHCVYHAWRIPRAETLTITPGAWTTSTRQRRPARSHRPAIRCRRSHRPRQPSRCSSHSRPYSCSQRGRFSRCHSPPANRVRYKGNVTRLPRAGGMWVPATTAPGSPWRPRTSPRPSCESPCATITSRPGTGTPAGDVRVSPRADRRSGRHCAIALQGRPWSCRQRRGPSARRRLMTEPFAMSHSAL
jgi:hypothetical protein